MAKWTDYYKSEQELIDDMLLTKSDSSKCYYYQLVKGYEFIEGFKKYYAKNKCLTDKQMTQLKRMAWSVYANVHNDNMRVRL